MKGRYSLFISTSLTIIIFLFWQCKEEPIIYSSNFGISLEKDTVKVYIDSVSFSIDDISAEDISELKIWEDDSIYFKESDNNNILSSEILFFKLHEIGAHTLTFSLKNNDNLSTSIVKNVQAIAYRYHTLSVEIDSTHFVYDTVKKTAFFENANMLKCYIVSKIGDAPYNKDSLITVKLNVNSETTDLENLYLNDTVAYFEHEISDTSYSYSFTFTMKDIYNHPVSKKITVKSFEPVIKH